MNRHLMRLVAVEKRLLRYLPSRYCSGSGTSGGDDGSNGESKSSKSHLNSLLNDFVAKSLSTPKKSNEKLMQFAIRPNRKFRTKETLSPAEKKAKEVADCYPADKKPQIEHELLTKLRELKELEQARKTNKQDEKQQQSVSLKNLLDGMRVEQLEEKTNSSKRRLVQSSKHYDNLPLPEIIGNSDTLGIFPENYANQVAKVADQEQNDQSYWTQLEKHQLELMVSMAPDNYFQQVIEWTETGKLWRFPIDNEQGMETEQNVPFYEHIFLEKHLDGWCPQKGPIRHFMELVCNGLSKNPFLTVDEKKEHIFWYRDFFESKKDLLPNYS